MPLRPRQRPPTPRLPAAPARLAVGLAGLAAEHIEHRQRAALKLGLTRLDLDKVRRRVKRLHPNATPRDVERLALILASADRHRVPPDAAVAMVAEAIAATADALPIVIPIWI